MMSNDDSKRLAPGQRLTRKFPVTGEVVASQELTTKNWRLEISGEVGMPVTLDFATLRTLPQDVLTRDIHCVTGWSRLGTSFEGVRLRELLTLVTATDKARYVRFAAYSDRNHDTSLPLDLALDDSWLVHRIDGKSLTPKHGFPVRVVTPSRYFYKSVKWLRKIEFLERDQLGFWERTSGYHNHGDPWQEERYEGTRFTSSAEVEAFRSLSDYALYRDQVVLKANLKDWEPSTRDLRGLQLKASDFRGAQLAGADFRGANLTRGIFAGANLERCDFSDADLEGADFTGARLAGAIFARNCLSAAAFGEVNGTGLESYERMIVRDPRGLLESQEAYLKTLGLML